MMGRLWGMASEPGRATAVRLHTWPCRGVDLRTLRQYLLDPVLPVVTLLLMSVLTVIMIVVVVGAVADMGRLFQDNPAGEAFQPGWSLTQAPWYDGAYSGYMASTNSPEESSLQFDSQAQAESSYAYSMSE
jgi:hypothetical protein